MGRQWPTIFKRRGYLFFFLLLFQLNFLSNNSLDKSDVVFLDNRSSIRFSFQNILAEKMKKGGSNGYNGGKKFKSHSMNVKFFDLRYGATRCNFFAPAYTPWSDAVEESDGIIYVIDHFSLFLFFLGGGGLFFLFLTFL